MGGPSEKTIRHLFADCGNRCAFPDCDAPIVEATGIITGEICHIHARNPRGPRYDAAQTDAERHGHANLLLLCRRHHKIVDDAPEIYSAEVLREIEALRAKESGRSEQSSDGIYAKILLNDFRQITANDNYGNIAIDSPGAIQGQVIHLKTSRKTIQVSPPPGTIGADQEAARYVQYLISRYNEFASAEPTRATKFSYGALSKTIEHTFGSPWKLLPAEKFTALCDYLHQRIGRTRIAKQNAAKGHRSFSSFQDFTQKTSS